jgi:hypothetical protein
LLNLKLSNERRPLGQSVLLRHSHLEAITKLSFLLTIVGFFYVGHTLRREDGSEIDLYNCFWALPRQSLSSPNPSELTTISYSLLWDSPNLEGQVPIFISSRNRLAQLYTRALGSLSVTPYDSQGCGRGILTRLHTWSEPGGPGSCIYFHQEQSSPVIPPGTGF